MNGEIIVSIVKELENYGPLGLVILAFISNMIPGFPALYLSLLASYAAITGSVVNSLTTIGGVGIGAGLGKFALFILSKTLGSKIGRVARRREEVLPILKARRGGLAVTVFLFAALPLPDDLLYIPLGVAGFNNIIFLLSVVAGKIVMVFLVFLVGSSARWILELTVPKVGELTMAMIMTLTAITLIPALLITYVIIAVDWVKVYRTYAEKGEGEAAKVLTKEFVNAVTFKNARAKHNKHP